jgi:hypothetical protein
VELAARWEAEAELGALRSSVAWVLDLVLGGTDGSFLLEMSMSAVAKLLESWIDTATAKKVRWGSRSALVAAVSHFMELDADLEVLGSGCNAGMTEDELDALWS